MANRITTVVEYAVRDAIKSLQDTQKELGKTEISGKDLADALRKAADDSERELDSIARASSAMETALGADFVEARRQAGVSVDDIVMELSNLGVSFNNIETDAKELAEAVKRLDDVRTPIKNVGTEAQDASTKLDMVRDSGDQSRSVLANLVGNSAQDLGELGGVAGTAGVAIGQLAEYAVDGNIQLSNLAKVAGPMALLTAGGLALNAVMNAQREAAADLRRETELLVDVERARAEGDTASVVEKLAEEYRDTLPILEKYGIGVAEIDEVLGGNTSSIEELREQQKLYDAQLRNTIGLTYDEQLALRSKVTELGDVIDTLEEADTAQGNAREQIEKSDHATRAWTEYLEDETVPVIDDSRAAVQKWHDEMRRAEQRTRDLEAAYKKLTGELDDREAWLNVEEQVGRWMTVMGDAESTTREQEQALIDVKQKLVEYLGGLEGVPPEKQTQILAMIDQGQIGQATAQLDALARTRTAEFKILVEQVTSAEIKQMENRLNRDINGNGVIGRARGGPVWPGGVFAVGDNPDGSWNRTTELFVPSTSGTILSAGESRAALAGMGGGGTTIINYVTVEAPALSSPAEVGAKVREILLADARTNGPVFATVRG